MAPFYPFYPPYLNLTHPANTTNSSQPCNMSHSNNTYTSPALHADNVTVSESVPPAQPNRKLSPWIWVMVAMLIIAIVILYLVIGTSRKKKKVRRARDIEAARQHVVEAYATMNEPLPVDHPYYSGREERGIRRLRDEMGKVVSGGRFVLD